MPEKAIVDAFKSVFPNAEAGPAEEFFTGGSDGLERAVAMVQIVMLDRQGLNPYRADLMDKLDKYAQVPVEEVEAAQHMLNRVKSIRKATAPKQAPTMAIANAVKTPAVIETPTVDPMPQTTITNSVVRPLASNTQA